MGNSSYLIFNVPFLDNYKVYIDNSQAYEVTVDKTGGIIANNSNYKPFCICTDAEVVTMAQDHYNNKIDITKIWSVGDSRTIDLSSMASSVSGTTTVWEEQPAQTQEFVILDFNHDDLQTSINGHSKAAVSIGMKDCLNIKGKIHYNTYSGGDIYWTGVARYNWCSIFFNSLPTILKNYSRMIRKQYNSGGYSNNYNCYCWLLSVAETTGESSGSSISGTVLEGTQYEYYKTASNRIKKVNGTISDWWTRSWYARAYGSGGYSNIFHYITSSGNQTTDYGYITQSKGISPGFCI